MSSLQLLIVLSCAALAFYHFLSSGSRKRKASNLPPGPFPFPVVGNIFQVGRQPHSGLAKLSKTYGPLMTLQLGNANAAIVSSPAIAQEILQKHDHACSGRLTPAAMHALDHHKLSMVCYPVGKTWRKIRKIFKEQLFATHRLDASESLRQEKLQRLCEYVQEHCDGGGREVNVSHAIFVALLNLMSGTLFTSEVAEFDSDDNQEFKENVLGIFRHLGIPNFADLFPILAPFDPQGLRRKMHRYFGRLFELLDDIIKQRLKERGASLDYQKKNDFLETLLDISEGSDEGLTTEEIKHLFLDLLVAGTESNVSAVEWTVTELLLKPDKLKRAKKELREVMGDKKQMDESDISRLPYLQAVVKEVFRLHPPGPLLFPHKSESAVEVSGYTLPKGMQILINAWAIGRDSSRWSNPHDFEPERFLDQKIDFKGQDFELIPFGSGRRSCPGMPLASRVVHATAATLIHNFDWKLEVSAEEAIAHREEVYVLALQKKIPLVAVPIKCEA